MQRGFVLFALFCALSLAFRDQLTEDQQMLFDDYNTAIEKLGVIIPTLENGGEEALEALKTLRRIMGMVLTRFEAEKNLPELPSDPIKTLKEAVVKVDQLIEAREIINNHKQEEEETEETEESSVVLNPCTAGPCCNVKDGVVFAAGKGCVITDPCQEPAALCNGLDETCATSAKPDGTNCGTAMSCYSGVCQRSKESIRAENEAKMIAIKEAELLKQKAIHRMLKVRRKQEAKQQKEHIVKRMLKKFAVMSWMNKKANSWEADIKAGDYVQGLPNAPSHREIFQHHYLGGNDNILHGAANFPMYDDDTEKTVESTSSTVEASPAEASTANLMASSLTQTSSSVAGFVLIGVGLILIVVYFVFGGKKPQPQTIY